MGENVVHVERELQQIWVCLETGEAEWRGIMVVAAEEDKEPVPT